jgi:hypothetical protein
MPTLSPSTEALRALVIFEILEEMQGGLKEAEACEKHGISVSQFRRSRDREAEGTMAIQQIIADNTRARLSLILMAQQKALNKVIEDLDSPFLKPLEKLSILRTLETLGDKLAIEARIGDGVSEDTQDVLSGPLLRPGKNRLQVSVQVSVDSQETSSRQESQVVDGHIVSPPLLQHG